MDDTTVPMGEAGQPGPDRPKRSDDPAVRATARAASPGDERLEVLPFYHDLRNQIVRPLNLHVETRYFFRKWKSELGPVLTLLIMELRDRCYYNPRTGERRDYCWPSQEELARAIGVSVRTVIRALQDPLAGKFIRVQHRYRYDPALGKKVRTSSAYVVSMDDPLRPEDEAVLTRMVAEQILAEETARRDQLLASQTNAAADDRGAAPRATTENPRASGGAGESAAPERSPSRRPDPTRRTADLRDALSDRSPDHQTAKMSSTSAPPLTANLSPIVIDDKLAEEEVLLRRDTQQKDNQRPVSPRLLSAPDVRTHLLDQVVQTYADANDRPPTPLERQRLTELVERFDAPARSASTPSTGAEWVISAIVEAVDSGSAFVAPRRIATICERWAAATRSAFPRREAERRRRRRGDDGPTRTTGEAPPRSDPDEAGPAEAPADPFDEPVELAMPTFVVSVGRPVANWQLWRLITDELAAQSLGQRHRRWLDQAAIIGEDDGALLVGAPSGFARDLLERRLGGAIAQAVGLILGEACPVRFVVSRDWLEARANGSPLSDAT